MSQPLLDVQHLTVTFRGSRTVTAVDDVSFHVEPGETLGVVGESGSGKSVTAFSIMRLLQPPGRITGGRVLFEGRDLLSLSEREMREVRGARIVAHLSGTDDGAESRDARRRSDRGSAHRARPGQGRSRAHACDRAAGGGANLRTGAARPRLPAPAVGRHASAGDDCDRPRVSAAARHRRRADHRPRRDDPGRGARAVARAARRGCASRSCSSRTTSASSPKWPTASP